MSKPFAPAFVYSSTGLAAVAKSQASAPGYFE